MMKRILTAPLLVIAAIIVFFEEWLWFRLLAVMKRIAAFPGFKLIEKLIKRQNKWVSLLLFAIPELSFIPVKLGIVWLFGNHHPYLGVLVFISAKIAGTATFAWMYSATEEKITQFAFVRWIRDKVLAARNWAHTWFRQQPTFVKATMFIHALREKIKNQKSSSVVRRLKAAIVLLKK